MCHVYCYYITAVALTAAKVTEFNKFIRLDTENCNIFFSAGSTCGVVEASSASFPGLQEFLVDLN